MEGMDVSHSIWSEPVQLGVSSLSLKHIVLKTLFLDLKQEINKWEDV